jgi:hypothetical protein
MAALCQSADAQVAECKSLTDPASRLGCYEKANPPIATYPTPGDQASDPPGSSHEGGQYWIGGFARWGSAVNAQLKNIRRGC